jgi:hypothetical protein
MWCYMKEINVWIRSNLWLLQKGPECSLYQYEQKEVLVRYTV